MWKSSGTDVQLNLNCCIRREKKEPKVFLLNLLFEWYATFTKSKISW